MVSSISPINARPAIAIWIMIAILSATESASAGYTVTDLGVLPGGTDSSGMGINVFGFTVATGGVGLFQTHAAFGSTTGLTDAGTLHGGSNSVGYGINDGGQIVGSSEISVMTANGATIQTHAFTATNGGTPQDLGTAKGDVGSAGYGINSNGVVAGASFGVGGVSHAVLINGPNSFVSLGTLGGTNSASLAVNNNNVATGWAQVASGAGHAFVTGPTGLIDLGVLPGFTTSQGQAINLAGQVVGFSGSPGSSMAFLYNPGSSWLTSLGLLPFAITSRALGINDTGAIIGDDGFNSGPSHGFVRDPSTGALIDLNTLLVASSNLLITSAAGINDQNMIIATATIGSETHAVLLTPIPGQDPFLPPPVPEPSSWLLLIAGGVALGLKTWRGRSASSNPHEHLAGEPADQPSHFEDAQGRHHS